MAAPLEELQSWIDGSSQPTEEQGLFGSEHESPMDPAPVGAPWTKLFGLFCVARLLSPIWMFGNT
jgi:hypothetical protein